VVEGDVSHGARFTKRYTDEQKTAFLKAVLVDGLAVQEAMRRAADGRLGVPAFEGRGTHWGYTLRNTYAAAFEAMNDEALAAATQRELRAAHLANLKALRELPADADPARRASAAKALRETQRAMEAPSARGVAPKRKAEPEPAKPEKPDGTLGELLAMAGNAKGPRDGGPSNGAGEG
jgi:hypothetical protein